MLTERNNCQSRLCRGLIVTNVCGVRVTQEITRCCVVTAVIGVDGVLQSGASVGRSVSAVETRVDALSRVVDGITNWKNTAVAIGRVTFKVDGFSAMKASGEARYSPHFYSHTNGYKLRLLVYPGGNGSGQRTHVSAYIVVCKGEYDDLLEWPCEHSFTISVVNQRSGENHTSRRFSHSTAVDEYKHSYHKPIKGDNPGLGYHAFIPHTSLQSSPGLIVGDALLLRCIVTPPP